MFNDIIKPICDWVPPGEGFFIGPQTISYWFGVHLTMNHREDASLLGELEPTHG